MLPPKSIFGAGSLAGASSAPATTGRWAPGNHGRRQGTRKKLSLARDMLEAESEELVARVLADALNGDAVAQRACLARLRPRRELPVEIDLPPIVTAHDSIVASGTVTAMVGEGRLTPSKGYRLAGMIEMQRRAIETDALERRILNLEREAFK
jgi:hypothetical protein